jgi:hypothetical protein
MLSRLPFSGAIHRGWRAAVVGGFTLPCPDSAVQWLKTAPDGVWLPDSKGTGTARTPQQGRCYTGGSAGEYASTGTGLAVAGRPRSIVAWVKIDAGRTAFTYPFGVYDGSGNRLLALMTGASANQVWLIYDDTSMTNKTLSGLDGAWHHFALVYNGTTATLYIDGVAQSTGGSKAEMTDVAGDVGLLARNTGVHTSLGQVFGVHVYDDSLTANEVTWLYTFGESGDDPGTANLLACYRCDEQAGTVMYNANGDGNDGTITSSALATFHGSTQDVYSWQNQVGYSNGGSGVFIPRDESDPTNDVLGNPLDYTGRVPLPAKIIQSHALTFNGSSQYVSVGGVGDSIKTVAFRCKADDITSHTDYVLWINSTDYITIVNGTVTVNGYAAATTTIYVDGALSSVIPDTTGVHSVVVVSDTAFTASNVNFGGNGTNYFDGLLCDVRMSETSWSAGNAATYHDEAGEASALDVAHQWPLAEGSGSACYNTVTGSDDLGVVVGTADWAATQDVFAFNANQGFRLSSGVKVPVRTNGTAADGGAITNPAVACWNHSESHIDFDPYGVPELVDFSNDYDPDVDDLALDGSQWVRRLSATQWNDFASYSAALTGSCLTSATTKFSIPTHLNSLILEHYPLQATEDADPGTQFAPALGSYYLSDGNDPNLVATAVGKNGNGLYIADDGGTYSAALGIAIGSDAAWNTDNAHTVAMWVKLNAKSSATDLKLIELQNGGGAGNYWTIFYDQSADRFAVTDGTNTLTDTVSPSLSQWYLLVLAVDLAGNANFYVMNATDGISGLRKQATSGWYVTTQNIGTINVCHTLAENEETVMDELLFFGNGTRRLYDNEISHLARENYATAGSF